MCYTVRTLKELKMKTYDVEVIVRVTVQADNEDDAIAQACEYASEEDLGFVGTFNVVEMDEVDG
jgi:hypothetical protein